MGHFFVDDRESLSEPDREIDDVAGLLKNYETASGGTPWRSEDVVAEIAKHTGLTEDSVEGALGYLEFEGVLRLKTKRAGKKKYITEVKYLRVT